MKLNSFKYFPHTLNFKFRFNTASNKLNTRKVFILKLLNENGTALYSEAAPLPEFNSETFDEVESELKKLSGKNVFEFGDSLEDVFNYINSLSNLPSVRFALEQIFISSLLKENYSFPQSIRLEKSINVNAVMGIEKFETAQEKLKQLTEQGYRIIKLKSDDSHFEELYDLISWTLGELGAKIKFRIDPNCTWNIKNTLQRSERLARLPVEYIEQPVKATEELIEISQKSSVPIAADESIRTLADAENLINGTKIKFIVIKPMLFGGIYNLLKLKKLLENKDMKIIISSSFESNIGRRHLLLSASIIENKLAHGLAASELLTDLLTEDVFPVSSGLIDFSLKKYSSELKLDF